MMSDRSAGDGVWPVRSRAAAGTNVDEPFFVLGSPRSGTTLLRAILCAHPELFIPPENGALLAMTRTFGRLRSSPWDEVVAAVLDAFRDGYEFALWQIDLEAIAENARALPEDQRSLAALIDVLYSSYGSRHAPGKRRWGDKSTPGTFHFLGRLSYVFPDARFVHIVRDGRDCVASSLRAGFFDRSHYAAAYAWRDNVRYCRRFGRRVAGSGRFLELRYEDLVSSPQGEIERLCAFLGVDAADSMLEHETLVDRSAPDVEKVRHHEGVRRPISTGSLERWRTQLSAPQIRSVSRIVASELRSYGYALA